MILEDSEPIEVLKYPYPYQAAFTVASDIDSASLPRFRAIHALFGRWDLIQEDCPEWRTLGFTSHSSRFDKRLGGVPGMGFDFADSFFLISDPTTFGMYRYLPKENRFQEDDQQGENCAALIRKGLKEGQIDSFHAFLHYPRHQVKPLLNEFYRWCERANVAKPRVWINHSTAVTPSGLCPDKLQPHSLYRLARLTARSVVGPLFGRSRLPLRSAFVRYQGDTPGSPYYVNDLLAANGLRYVWLNTDDLHRNQIALPEGEQNGRPTILQPVTMDDGVRYWRFERCYGQHPAGPSGVAYLRDSSEGCDASHLITEKNLAELCRGGGTCILYTHWTHFRSLPMVDETIARFEMLQNWQAAGKIWVTSTARLLEWTRRRTFLRIQYSREGERLIVNLEGLEDPIFGHETLELEDLQGLTLRTRASEPNLTIAINGKALAPDQVHRVGNLYWLDAKVASWPEIKCSGRAKSLIGQTHF